MKKRLLVALSSHGFGHFGQVAPVLQSLVRQRSDIEIIIKTTLPEKLLSTRLSLPFQYINHAADFGMCMSSGLDVKVQESVAKYAEFHANWTANLAAEKAVIAGCEPDVVLANIPYLTLAACKDMGVPSIALCSLNWAHIFAGYAAGIAQAESIYQQMLEGYNGADVFLNPAPSMPMPGLRNLKAIGPMALTGKNRRNEINEQCGLSPRQRLVLIAPGGIPTAIPLHAWPHDEEVLWITSWKSDLERDDVIPFERIGLPFSDLLASVDAVVTKPGYGMVAESVCNGVPVLYVLRKDWPEEPSIVRWLEENGHAREITREQFFTGNILRDLREMWERGTPPAVYPSGIAEAVETICELFSR